jgi:hypothetical protein
VLAGAPQAIDVEWNPFADEIAQLVERLGRGGVARKIGGEGAPAFPDRVGRSQRIS